MIRNCKLIFRNFATSNLQKIGNMALKNYKKTFDNHTAGLISKLIKLNRIIYVKLL